MSFRTTPDRRAAMEHAIPRGYKKQEVWDHFIDRWLAMSNEDRLMELAGQLENLDQKIRRIVHEETAGTGGESPDGPSPEPSTNKRRRHGQKPNG